MGAIMISFSKLFNKILNARYIHTQNGVDFAFERDKNVLYILFECSDGFDDWAKNFRFIAKPYKRMSKVWRCHNGFSKAYSSVKDDIMAYTKDFISRGDIEEIICAGYSHGAALAVLCTEDLQYSLGGLYRIQGVGFGTPRVLWGIVPKEVKKRLNGFIAVRNIDDLVTHVPPKILGFRDAGKIVKIGSKGKYSRIDAHRPESYQEELKGL
jgi:hypothetical protein